MTDLRIAIAHRENRVILERSDGKAFCLVGDDEGGAILRLMRGADTNGGPALVHMDRSVANKVDRAKAWALAYPNHPSGA